MADDREVLKEIWGGRLPICFRISPDEVVTVAQPEPYYIMLPRVSYFPLVTDKVIKYFARFVAQIKQQGTDLWLDFDGQPIKLHYPIGLSWDLFSSDTILPWNLTVHFDNFPEEDIIRCNNKPAIESMFMSSIKEADCLKHRSQVMMKLQKKEHNQLWHGLLNDKFDQFWAINKKLMEHIDDELFRYIPLKIYSSEINHSIQKLVKPTSESGDLMTLGDLINLNFLDQGNSEITKYKLKIHGIEPPFDTPLQWLSEHFSYPDNFLHFVSTTDLNKL